MKCGVNFDKFGYNNLSTQKKYHDNKKFISVPQVSYQVNAVDALALQGKVSVGVQRMSFGGANDIVLRNFYAESTDFSDDVIEEFLMLTPSQREEALALYKEGAIPDHLLCAFIKLDSDLREKMLKLIRTGITPARIYDLHSEYQDGEFVKIEKSKVIKQCDMLLGFIDNKVNPAAIDALLEFGGEINEKSLRKATDFIDKISLLPDFIQSNNTATSVMVNSVSEFDDESFNRCLSLLDDGFLNFELITTMCDDENLYKKGRELIKAGYSEADTMFLLDVNEEQEKEIINFANEHSVSLAMADYLLKLDDKQRERAFRLMQYMDAPTIHFLNLSNSDFEGVIELLEDGCSADKILTVAYGGVWGFSSARMRELIQKNRMVTVKWEEFLQTSENATKYKDELNKKDIYFLKNHMFDNEFYSPEEYINEFLFLKNLKTPNGESVLGCEAFTNKIKENGLGDSAAILNDLLYGNIETLLLTNPKSKKYKSVLVIADLITKGYVNPSAFRKLPNLSDILSNLELMFGYNSNSKYIDEKTNLKKWNISNNLMNDIDFMQSGINGSNWLDKYVPEYKSDLEGISKSKIGDAFVVEGEQFIRIKTRDDKSDTVKLTKETYAKLFPPVERFLTTQGIMGNCYCIETLISMYCNNDTRIYLLNAIEEDKDGNIIIKFPDYKPVIFDGAKLPKEENTEIYSSGADGYKLFEYAYSCALVEDAVKKAQSRLFGEELLEFQEFIRKNPNNFYIENNEKEVKWMLYSDFMKKNDKNDKSKSFFAKKSYNTFNDYLLGNGGLQNDIYSKFGFNFLFAQGEILEGCSKKTIVDDLKKRGIQVSIDNVITMSKAKRLIKKPDFLKNHQVQIGLGMHAYCLTQENNQNAEAEYFLYNPHNQGFPIKIDSLDWLFEKISSVAIVEIE